MSPHPIMKIADIGDGIDNTSGSENVSIFSEESGRDDAGLVLAGFEMRIREEEEESRKGMFGKVIWHELHGVCTDDGHVLIRAGKSRVLWGGSCAKGDDTVMDVL